MQKALRGKRLQSIGCNTRVLPKQKNVIDFSLMARNYQLHARLHRLCGCFFICGMFGGGEQTPARVVWKSWYSLYSCALMGLMICIDLDVIVTKIIALAHHDDSVHHGVRAAVHSVLFARMIVCFLCAAFSSSKLLAFYSRASAFERRIGMRSCDSNIARSLFWSDARDVVLGIAYCVGYTLTLTKLPPYDATNNLGDSPWKQAYYWLTILFTVIFYHVYDNVCTVSLRCACEVLAEYIRNQLRLLKACLSVPGPQSLQRTGTARCVESVRLNVATIRRLKEEVNDIWGVPLILSSFCLVLVVSGGVYEICRHDTSITEQSSLLLYTLWLCFCFVQLASASQSLTNSAKEMKNFCKGVGFIDDIWLGHEIEDLYDSIEPEDMCLKGGNFFQLNMSLLVSMTGAMVTYTVILVQTNQTLNESLNGTFTHHHDLA